MVKIKKSVKQFRLTGNLSREPAGIRINQLPDPATEGPGPIPTFGTALPIFSNALFWRFNASLTVKRNLLFPKKRNLKFPT